MIKRMGALCLFLSLLLSFITSCSVPREKTYYQYFDTVINLSAEGMRGEDFEALCAEAEAEISKYHRAFDIYHEIYSEKREYKGEFSLHVVDSYGNYKISNMVIIND